MPDLVLKDGREIEIDLHVISRREYASLSNIAQPPEEEFELVGRVIGWSKEDTGDIPLDEYQLLIKKLILKVRNPVSDPN